MPSPASRPVPGKYARVERERRFLLTDLPGGTSPASARRIIDRYLISTSLRLRHISSPESDQYKLTQKIPATCPGPVQGLITNIYLPKTEHDHLAAALPARTLAKTRHSVPPLGIGSGSRCSFLVILSTRLRAGQRYRALPSTATSRSA
jgi:hypothetical protein